MPDGTEGGLMIALAMPAAIFCARVADVSMGTVRTICVVRGRRVLAVVFGFFEVLIWMFAVSSVLSRLTYWPNIIAYAAGYATGNGVGMWIENKLALGVQALTFISRGQVDAVAERLRSVDQCVTALVGKGQDGPISICLAIVHRKLAPLVIQAAREVDPEVVVTVEDVRESSAVMRHSTGAGKTLLPFGRMSVPSYLRSISRSAPDSRESSAATMSPAPPSSFASAPPALSAPPGSSTSGLPPVAPESPISSVFVGSIVSPALPESYVNRSGLPAGATPAVAADAV